MSDNNNQIYENQKDIKELQNKQESNQKEDKNKTQKKDPNEEKVNELKAIYAQMIKFRKENLEVYKKIDQSN